MWYMNAENEIIEGPMKIEGNNWTMTFRGTDPEGKMADLSAEVTRKSPDLYHRLVREKAGGRLRRNLWLSIITVLQDFALSQHFSSGRCRGRSMVQLYAFYLHRAFDRFRFSAFMYAHRERISDPASRTGFRISCAPVPLSEQSGW